MATFVLVFMFLSHVGAAQLFLMKVRHQQLPATADFAAISVILYHDIGLGLELLGYPYENPLFGSLLHSDEATRLIALTILTLVPWLLYIGSLLTSTPGARRLEEPISSIRPPARPAFYLLVTLVSLALALWGYLGIRRGESIWTFRARVGAELGASIIVLYLPMHFLAFYVRQSDARTKWGAIFSLGLALATVLSTAGAGQRSSVLLPFLIIGLFRSRITVSRLLVVGILLVAIAGTLLPVFKWQYYGSHLSTRELIAQTIHADFSRSPILATVLEMSEPLGTRVMPYPLAGYVYSLLFFIPRQIAPFKGRSTAVYFTAHIMGVNPEHLNWGYGLGLIEEIMLNAGLWALIPGLLAYGMCMGALDRMSRRVPSLVAPARLAALWICGYHLAALLLTFGTMALATYALDSLFVGRPYVRAVRQTALPVATRQLGGKRGNTSEGRSFQRR